MVSVLLFCVQVCDSFALRRSVWLSQPFKPVSASGYRSRVSIPAGSPTGAVGGC